MGSHSNKFLSEFFIYSSLNDDKLTLKDCHMWSLYSKHKYMYVLHLTDDKISSYIKRPYLQIQYLIEYNWSSSHKSWLPWVVRVFSRVFFQWTATLIHVVKWLGFSLIYIFCQTVYKLNIGVFTFKKNL